ncbi:MAG: hypothetical protein R3E79_38555 [Caldilineaceae bacterium]
MSRESVSSAWGPAGAQLAYVTGRATPGAGGEAPLLYLWTLTPGQAPNFWPRSMTPSSTGSGDERGFRP